MIQVPYGNCFSWLKTNSQTLREERTLQQPMVNNETIMLSERATPLRDIRFGIQFLEKNVVSFSFTLFFFIYFLTQTRKRRTQLTLYQQFKMYERITVSKDFKDAHLH